MTYTGLKHQGKPPWTINIHLKKNEVQEGKIGLFWGVDINGRRWAQGKGE
jgi:hypothetical protein